MSEVMTKGDALFLALLIVSAWVIIMVNIDDAKDQILAEIRKQKGEE